MCGQGVYDRHISAWLSLFRAFVSVLLRRLFSCVSWGPKRHRSKVGTVPIEGTKRPMSAPLSLGVKAKTTVAGAWWLASRKLIRSGLDALGCFQVPGCFSCPWCCWADKATADGGTRKRRRGCRPGRGRRKIRGKNAAEPIISATLGGVRRCKLLQGQEEAELPQRPCSARVAWALASCLGVLIDLHTASFSAPPWPMKASIIVGLISMWNAATREREREREGAKRA